MSGIDVAIVVAFIAYALCAGLRSRRAAGKNLEVLPRRANAAQRTAAPRSGTSKTLATGVIKRMPRVATQSRSAVLVEFQQPAEASDRRCS